MLTEGENKREFEPGLRELGSGKTEPPLQKRTGGWINVALGRLGLGMEGS